MAATSTVGVVALTAGPAAAASGGGCTTYSYPNAAIRACINATFLNANPNGTINAKGCTSAVVQLVDVAENRIYSTAFVGCGQVSGNSYWGAGHTWRTHIIVSLGSSGSRDAWSPILNV